MQLTRSRSNNTQSELYTKPASVLISYLVLESQISTPCLDKVHHTLYVKIVDFFHSQILFLHRIHIGQNWTTTEVRGI